MTSSDHLTSSEPTPGVENAQNGAADPAPPTADRALLGLDNVRLDLPLAGVGSRVLAASLDYTLLALLMILWALVCAIGLGVMAGSLSSGWVMAILIIGIFLLQWGYFAGLEIAMGGRTPGKLAVGLRVVTHRGGRVGAVALLIRGLLRVVDNLVAVPLLALDRRCRRLGDMVAGTLVVHERAGQDEEIVVERAPASWGAREVAVVEGLLRRADRLEGERAERLATRLLRWIEREEPDFLTAARPEYRAHPDDALTTLRAAVTTTPAEAAAEPIGEPTSPTSREADG